MDAALARNHAFATAGGHRGATIMPALRIYVITCLDPRLDPAAILGLELGDAAVVRNAGGRVTDEVIADVAFIGQLAESAFPDGPLFDVAVIHHDQCGTGALADDTFRAAYATRTSADPATLLDRAVLDPETTVRTDATRLRAAPAVPARVAISGHVYRVETGLLETIVPAAGV
ncbi:carbonic anhydrase [Baekduia alba]|uniref:carbonic anhydrase n=1 Tax=Baekduia alba TaxID=2997333 RepID=UPI00234235EC|nr:carbonic anhydrase [Baekduia alba]